MGRAVRADMHAWEVMMCAVAVDADEWFLVVWVDGMVMVVKRKGGVLVTPETVRMRFGVLGVMEDDACGRVALERIDRSG